jgi:signal transduction histidine kinase
VIEANVGVTDYRELTILNDVGEERARRGVLSRFLARLRRGATEATGAGAVWLTPQGVVAASRDARRILGRVAAPGADAAGFIETVSGGAPAHAEALRALMAEGRSCRFRIALGAGAIYEIEGAPDGRAARIALRDASAAAAEEARLRAERDAARAEAAALRAALDEAGAPIWRLDEAGAVLWRSRAAGDAPPPSADDASQRVAFEGGALICADPVEGGAEAPGIRAFAETVSQTFAQLRVGIAAFDGARRLALANPALAEMFGADPDWLARRPDLRALLDDLRERRRLPEQADYPAWRAGLFTLFDDPKSAAYEDVWDLPDGRTIHVLGRPYPSGGVLFVFEDVTESVALQRWRSTAVEVRRATLEMLAEGVAVFGPDGRVRIANPAFRAMWDIEDTLRSAHIADLAARCAAKAQGTEIWTRIRAAVASVEGRAPWSGRARLADGRALLARIAPMPDGSTLAAFTDVTDGERIAEALRDRAAALEAADEMRNALVDQLSHQLRTPLNAIFGFSDMLVEGRLGMLSEPQAGYLRHIRSAADLLRAGVENLADLATMRPGLAGEETREVALGPVLKGAAGLMERRALDRGAHISLLEPSDGASLRGDPARLRQMLYNLLSAVVSHAGPGDTLTLGVEQDGETIAIWCAGRACVAAGDDIGLSLARRVAEQHGGGLALETRPEGGDRLVCRLSRGRAAKAA